MDKPTVSHRLKLGLSFPSAPVPSCDKKHIRGYWQARLPPQYRQFAASGHAARDTGSSHLRSL